MNFYIKNIKFNDDVNKGFTLIEVLVATIIMAIVVALAGTAFVGILKQNRKAELESERRSNLNRALNYVANEIRMAKTVVAADSTASPPTTTTITSGTGVMRLIIPVPNPASGVDASGTKFYNNRSYTVVYYTSGSWTGWDSPNSIWRYSNARNPLPDATGTNNPNPSSSSAALTVPSPSPTSGTDVDHNFLVDGIQDPSSGAPTCPSGSTLRGGSGFYACIYTNTKQVDLYLYGNLSNTTNETIEVKTTVFTRSN
ncbi:prepilin-type N-terminal cleavage/methylation domain-containing protein [Anabaena sphaerica FACHB-251]|uniref:Prepilin-type N-terminal cleavage/methylation domain-containing protein n=1 Tax=Anabaena sphaerica FACHB-251 TaxID=2692883 RepID=A0A927A1L3_9NOST|nr:prepilin-type N-terminal cleavage/methylation domain-containing protein [Anabaena sphaerica]MBD2293555.1 prepilin-type N-terminal cleavage/methylation domain-containing protein [Anabaena sphaerica FACHB-251]